MQKIPTVFVRDETSIRRYVTDQVTPGCEWVFTDRDVSATRKFDGVCMMLDSEGNWFARHVVKPGKQTPPNFTPVQHDPVTGSTVGWIPIAQSGFAKYHAEALADTNNVVLFKPGTYELVGPKVNGNPEGYDEHWLIKHEYATELSPGPFTPEGIRALVLKYKKSCGYEGIVFHHPDGRMAKLKARDYPREAVS